MCTYLQYILHNDIARTFLSIRQNFAVGLAKIYWRNFLFKSIGFVSFVRLSYKSEGRPVTGWNQTSLRTLTGKRQSRAPFLSLNTILNSCQFWIFLIPSDKMMEYVKSVVKVGCDDILSFDIQGFKKQISSMSVEEVNDYLSLINWLPPHYSWTMRRSMFNAKMLRSYSHLRAKLQRWVWDCFNCFLTMGG